MTPYTKAQILPTIMISVPMSRIRVQGYSLPLGLLAVTNAPSVHDEVW
jgi:hypothetical protein